MSSVSLPPADQRLPGFSAAMPRSPGSGVAESQCQVPPASPNSSGSGVQLSSLHTRGPQSDDRGQRRILATGSHLVMFVLEHPEDPQQYTLDYEGPSLWVFPEMLDLRETFGMHFVSFDQGALGHAHPKPTRLLTNSWLLYKDLQGLRVKQQDRVSLPRPSSWAERFEQSRSWAAWAPSLNDAIRKAWEAHHVPAYARVQAMQMDQCQLQALDASWKTHFEQDHRPFRRDCRVCLQASARGRKHHRLTHPVCFSLSLDIMGPLGPGEDIDSSFAFKAKKSYAVVAAYTLPVLSEGELITREPTDHPIPADWQEDVELDPVPEPQQDPCPRKARPSERLVCRRIRPCWPCLLRSKPFSWQSP